MTNWPGGRIAGRDARATQIRRVAGRDARTTHMHIVGGDAAQPALAQGRYSNGENCPVRPERLQCIPWSRYSSFSDFDTTDGKPGAIPSG
jgi:hypothetical protein